MPSKPVLTVVFGIVFLVFGAIEAQPQVPEVQGRCVENCGSGSSSSSGSSGGGINIIGILERLFGGSSGSDEPSGPSPEELRRIEARALNDKGIEAFQNRDWAKAVDYFRKALSYQPNDSVIQSNLRRAEEESRRAEALASMRAGIDRLTESLTRQSPSSDTGLRFIGTTPSTPQGTGPESQLTFMTSTGALEQLVSAERHGEEARRAAEQGSLRRASDTARQVFDTPGQRTGSLEFMTGLGAPMKRRIEIPSWLADHPEIRRLQDQRIGLVNQLQNLENQLDSIRQRKARGEGDRSDLDVQEANTKQEISNVKNNIGFVDGETESFVIRLTRETSPSQNR